MISLVTDNILNLELSEKIGTGNERECYLHPLKTSLCIKVNREGISHRKQNILERYYLASLKMRRVPFLHIAEYYGTIKTNKGKALVYEYISDYNGRSSMNIVEALTCEKISNEELLNHLNHLKSYLIKYWISLGDVNPDQIKIQQTKDGSRLVLIDGLGARRIGLKLILVSCLPCFAKRKTKKNWKKLINKIEMIQCELRKIKSN